MEAVKSKYREIIAICCHFGGSIDVPIEVDSLDEIKIVIKGK